MCVCVCRLRTCCPRSLFSLLGVADFKNHNDLPLARIKRIMKSDEDVRMIRAEAPVLFAKACELFILELTLRAYCFSEKTERRNLQKEDIFTAVRNTDIFDFLEDVLTEKEQSANGGGGGGGDGGLDMGSAGAALGSMGGGQMGHLGQLGDMGQMGGIDPQ